MQVSSVNDCAKEVWSIPCKVQDKQIRRSWTLSWQLLEWCDRRPAWSKRTTSSAHHVA